jgi:hypothetical protein
MSDGFLPVIAVMAHFPKPGPSARYVRERMMDLGFAQRIGRQYYTTAAQIERFVEFVKENGLCKTKPRGRRSNRPSEREVGTREVRSRSASEVELPENELNAALARVAKPRPSAKRSAMT